MNYPELQELKTEHLERIEKQTEELLNDWFKTIRFKDINVIFVLSVSRRSKAFRKFVHGDFQSNYSWFRLPVGILFDHVHRAVVFLVELIDRAASHSNGRGFILTSI